MQSLWFVSIPNNKDKGDDVYNQLKTSIFVEDICRVRKLDIPPLSVGTLDGLMGLSDELNRVNTQIEGTIRKVERQYLDISTGDVEPLRINDLPLEKYFQTFQWDFARYQHQGRQLGDLVNQIQSSGSKIDEELKKMSASYTDKVMALSTLQRKKVINLSTSDFEDILKPEAVARLDFVNTDNLLTMVVAVPKGLEQEFLKNYASIGSEIAYFGGPDWTNSSNIGGNDGRFGEAAHREAKKGSPVVPDSAVKIVEEGDSVLYSITVLKGHHTSGKIENDAFVAGTFVSYLEPLKLAFRDKRMVLREFQYDPAKSGGLDNQIAQVTQETQQAHAALIRWCKTHYGEVYNGWMHIKLIRQFVESVLRYGLPVDFTTVLIKPNPKREKQFRDLLMKSIGQMRPEILFKKQWTTGEEDEEDPDNYPFVCQKFVLIGV